MVVGGGVGGGVGALLRMVRTAGVMVNPAAVPVIWRVSFGSGSSVLGMVMLKVAVPVCVAGRMVMVVGWLVIW